MFSVSDVWENAFPGACIGVLTFSGVCNPEHSTELEGRKREIEAELREKYAGLGRPQLKAHPTLAAYAAYYKGFNKTYHVQLQLESIAHKGKSIPKVAALVEAMFMAELKNLLLTAGHDLDQVKGTPIIDVAKGDEIYVKLSGQAQLLKANDMYIHDDAGVLSSIIYGPAQHASLTPRTQRAVFTTYGVPGITTAQVQAHLEDLRDNIYLFAPDAQVEALEVIPATLP